MDKKNDANTVTISHYTFKEPKLFFTARTHSSYTNELIARVKGPISEQNNERLEFLGDAVLELIISEHIYNTYPELTEGEMTKLRASIVCESTLSEAAKTLCIGGLLRMGRGEEHTGGRERDSILADCFEAIAGAIFLDGGLPEARKFILDNLLAHIKKRRANFKTSDHKTLLQELVQRQSKEPLSYTVISEDGPPHDRTFVVRLTHLGKTLATGEGKTKKEAEQSCAKQAISRLKD